MKRYLSMALILVMLLTLSACGNSDEQAKAYESGKEVVQYVAPSEISDAESDRAEAYEKAIAALTSYLEDGDFVLDENYEEEYEHNDAAQTLYNMFCELGDYKDASEIANRFIIHDDKLVGVSVDYIDNLEQTTYSYEEYMEYNANGQLIKMSSNDDNYYVREFFYNESGQLTEELCYLNRRKLKCKTVYSYDDRGSIVGINEIYSSNIYDNKWDVFYDDAGRISRSEGYVHFDYYPLGLDYYSGSSRLYLIYSYNGQGELVSVTPDYNSSKEWYCDYDENGNIVKRTEMWDDKAMSTREYKYDENGRILEIIRVQGANSIDYHRYSFTYGTSYSFNADGLVL